MKINFNKSGDGLVPAIVQDAESLEVLMQGYMNEEALEKTLASTQVYFYSRSQGKLWLKGETSGDFLEWKEILTDCDQDGILIKAIQTGKATCHTGRTSCFHYRYNRADQVWELVG